MSYNLETGILKNKIYLKGNKPITNDIKKILNNYEIINLDKSFNQDLGNLPSNIKAIYFENDLEDEKRYYYRCKLLSENTTYFEDYKFNQSINNLPNGIEYLELRGEFNQPLDNLPNTLKYLYINTFEFNHSLDYLPSGLEYLILETSNISINNYPIGLKELYIHKNCSFSFYNLPIGLKTLFINGKYNVLNESFKLPDNIETLIFNDCNWNKHNLKILKNIQYPKKMMKIILPLHYIKDYSFFKDKIFRECSNNCNIKFKEFNDVNTFYELIKNIINKY